MAANGDLTTQSATSTMAANDDLTTQSATSPGGDASGRAPRRVEHLLPAEQGERTAALVRELRGGRNHVADEASAASYAGRDSGIAGAALSSAADPDDVSAVDSLAELVRELRGGRNHVADEASAASYAWRDSGIAAQDALVGAHAELNSAADTGDVPAVGSLFREPRGGVVEFSAADYAALYDIIAQGVSSGEEEREGEGMDRLSGLPNDVLSHIVGCLPLADAVRTQILSRRWRALPPRRSLVAVLFADPEEADSDGDEDAITSGVALQADRFSALPDHVICTVLCHLPLVEAIRTSILGRRWREVWTSLPYLDFDDIAVGEAGVSSFLDFVDGALARYSEMNIQRFLISVTHPENVDSGRLAAWSAQAAESVSGAVQFKVDLGDKFLQGEKFFEMPNQAVAKSIMVSISHPENISFRVGLTDDGKFGRLTCLILAGTRFTDDDGKSVSKIVSHDCPMLTCLQLDDVRGVFSLELTSTSLVEFRAMFVCDLISVEFIMPKLNCMHFGYSFAGKEGTKLSILKHELQEVVWNDVWPVHTDIGTVGRLDKLTVHRQNNPQNLRRIISEFRFKTVMILCVNISIEEDMEEVNTEVHSLRTPLHCEVLIQLSDNEVDMF